MAYQEDEVIFDIGFLRCHTQLLDDNRMGLRLESTRLQIHGIEPEAVIYLRNCLNTYLKEAGYE